jgi:hypothetical protein
MPCVLMSSLHDTRLPFCVKHFNNVVCIVDDKRGSESASEPRCAFLDIREYPYLANTLLANNYELSFSPKHIQWLRALRNQRQSTNASEID